MGTHAQHDPALQLEGGSPVVRATGSAGGVVHAVGVAPTVAPTPAVPGIDDPGPRKVCDG